MANVTLEGPSDDGRELIVTTAQGERFSLAVTDELRTAVRTVHARLQSQAPHGDPASSEQALTPKEIQQRIRSGLSGAELAELTGADVAFVERYEAPVRAERAYIAELARSTRIGRDAGSPVLGDLVTDRLAGRGVDPESVVWDAWREIDEPWHVCADFRVDGRSVRAEWTFDHTARAVTALDEEARWLTETELLDVPIPQRHLSAVRGETDNVKPLHESRPVSPATDVEPDIEPAGPTSTELLLDNLQERRGTRDTLDLDDDLDDDDFEGFGPAGAQRPTDVSFATGQSMPHPAGSALRQPEGSDGDSHDAGSPADAAAPPAVERKPAKKGRASVPSWDEIVFGAKHE